METPKTITEIAQHVERTVEDAKHITGVVRYLQGLLLITKIYEKSPTQDGDTSPRRRVERD